MNVDGQSIYGQPAPRPWLGMRDWLILLAVALVFGGLYWRMLNAGLRGLFGFGVILEAVPYPKLRENEDGQVLYERLMPSFVAVAAPSAVVRQLRRRAGPHLVDLFEATNAGAPPVVAPPADPQNLLLFTNLELVTRNRARRVAALAIMERISTAQTSGGFKIGMITDLSPLDRLLQSFERDEDERERAPDSARADLAGDREDLRWSRLFEGFTTYTYVRHRRSRAGEGEVAPEHRTRVDVVAEEVAYLPDHVVSAVIPDDTPERLEAREISDWAKGLQTNSPRAIVDFLSSQLIEHYQLIWSISSQAERLLLYRLAHSEVVNISAAYGLKSLVRRGLVVLDPVPRLMNRSFAQFVRHAEEPRTLKRWRKSASDGPWQALRRPLMIILPFALGVLALVAIRSGESLAALLPVMVSVGPALINFIGANRRGNV